MICPRCGSDNAANRRFCGGCGKPLAAVCSSCGFANEPGMAFCGGCGTALADSPTSPAPAERRQVAVLFADLAGFTKLTAELGAEDTKALLDQFFATVDRIVEQHGGSVDKHIGDCVMALFGAPVARGDDVARAARAAIAIRAAMPAVSAQVGRELSIHGGIAAGEVVASGDSQRRYSVTGETVNLAARLADLASAGEILVSDMVRLALGDHVRLEQMGDLRLQGFAQPQPAHRLLALSGAESREAGLLVGRELELHQLTEFLARLGTTGEGGLVVLRGDAGIGKTRLVRELEGRAAAHHVTAHSAMMLDFGVGEGRGLLPVLARRLLTDSLDGGEPSNADGLAEAVGSAAIDDRLKPFLLSLLGLSLSGAARQLVAATPVAERRRSLQDTVAALAHRAAERHPLLLIVEDVHWADRNELGGLAALVEALRDLPALFVLTTRHEGDPIDAAWLVSAAGPPTRAIDLRPLQDLDARKLAGQLLGSDQEEALERCVARSQGNPLFLEQLAKYLRERCDDDVPVSIQTVIQARLDRLEPIDRDALRAASILGQRFALPALHAVLGQANYDSGPLVQRQLVHTAPEGYLFAHALIRDFVYDLLLRSQRRELHQRAASYFADKDAALHAQHLDRADDPRAPQAYGAAARAQADAYRNEAAVDLAARGLDLAVTPADRFDLACLAGQLELDIGRAGMALDAFAIALEVAADEAGRVLAQLGLAEAMRLADRFDDALAHLTEAEAMAAAAGQMDGLARVHHLRGNVMFSMGRVEDCAREHAQALTYAQHTSSPELETRALGGLADAEFARGRMISANRAFIGCCELAQQHGYGRVEAANCPMVAHTLFYMLDMAELLRQADRAVALAKAVGHRRAELIAQLAAGWALLYQGELDGAAARTDEAEALMARIGATRFEPEVLQLRAEMCMLVGDAHAAYACAERALIVSRATSIGFMGASILGLIAWVSREASARHAAVAEGEAVLTAGTPGHALLNFRYYAIEASIAAEDWPEAERHAVALEVYSAAEPLPWSTFYSARARALARHARDPGNGEVREALARVRIEAIRYSLNPALRAIDAALAQPAT